MIFTFKIIFEFFILFIPILFALPNDTFIFEYDFIVKHKKIIFDILIWILPISIIGRYLIEYKLFKYKKENNRLLEAVKSYRSFLSGYIDEKLKEISQTINNTESERITVFLYSSSLNKFYSIGRYSLSSKYNKVGRYIIENEKEYLFSVLNDEKHYDKSPSIDNHWYSLPKQKRNMESNDMYGVPLFDSKRSNKIGVVVFQSMKTKVYSHRKEIRNKIADEVKKLNDEINTMNIEPNTIISNNQTLEGL